VIDDIIEFRLVISQNQRQSISPNKSKMKLQKWPGNPMGKYLNIFLAQHRREHSTLKLLRI